MSGAVQLLVCRGGMCTGQALLPWPRLFLPLRMLQSGPALSPALRESLRLLQLPEDGESSPAQVKEAYLRLAKLHHPDSRAATADAALFARVEQAYRAAIAHCSHSRQGGGGGDGEDEDRVMGVAPQHRQYLSYEGVGTGTPSQRQRQYTQFRVDRAAEQVLDYRQRDHERAAAAEGALVDRDLRQRSRQAKITQAVERLVEDLIQESMARGDFSNLPGAGKPLNKFQDNPYADPTTHNLNRILIDNGYQPAWIVAQRDIREMSMQLRERLLLARAGLGDPMTPRERIKWEELCDVVGEELVKLNKMVDDFNLIVPMLFKQMVHFSLERETKRAEEAARLQREERAAEREKERERRREERKRNRAATPKQRTRQGLLAWLRNLLK